MLLPWSIGRKRKGHRSKNKDVWNKWKNCIINWSVDFMWNNNSREPEHLPGRSLVFYIYRLSSAPEASLATLTTIAANFFDENFPWLTSSKTYPSLTAWIRYFPDSSVSWGRGPSRKDPEASEWVVAAAISLTLDPELATDTFTFSTGGLIWPLKMYPNSHGFCGHTGITTVHVLRF